MQNYSVSNESHTGRDATRIGAVVFSESVNVAVRLDDFETNTEVKNGILNIQYMGQTTNTPEGLKVCFFIRR